MILKFSYAEGWHFIDRIKEVQVRCIDIESYNKEILDGLKTSYANVFFSYHHLEPDGSIRENSKHHESGTTPKVQIYATTNNGELDVYLADLSVFLLSDEGKTIERIN